MTTLFRDNYLDIHRTVATDSEISQRHPPGSTTSRHVRASSSSEPTVVVV